MKTVFHERPASPPIAHHLWNVRVGMTAILQKATDYVILRYNNVDYWCGMFNNRYRHILPVHTLSIHMCYGYTVSGITRRPTADFPQSYVTLPYNRGRYVSLDVHASSEMM